MNRSTLYILLFFIFYVSNNYSQAKFYEVYPRLPKVDYLGVFFFNPDTGFAVGENGTIIKTTDGGKNWQQKETPTNLTLAKIQAFSKNNIFVCGLYGTLLHSSDLGETWKIINLKIESTLLAIKIIDEQTGWLCGLNSVLFKTEDAGKTWAKKTTGFTGNYRDIDFYEDSIGYICSTSGILVTVDSGNTWVNKGFTIFSTIEPVTDNYVIGGTPSGTIYYSEDRGDNWIKTREPFHSDIQSLEMLNDSVGYASANLYSGHYYSTNGGKNWLSSAERIGNSQIIFVDDTIGYGVGIDLTITKTTDGGKYWRRLILNEGITSIYFINEKDGFLGASMSYSFEKSKLYYTSDGGYSWQINEKINFDSNFIDNVNSIFFTDSLTGYIGGKNSKIYKTTNGGRTWNLKDTVLIIIDLEWVPAGYFNFWGDIGYSIISGFGGSKIKKTTDRGETWKLLGEEFNSRLTSIFFIDSLKGWITGINYLGQTTDGGNSWIEDVSLNHSNFYDVFFSDTSNGLITTDSNKVLKTVNGGQSWQITDLIGLKFIKVNENSIYLTSDKELYYSNDRGIIWTERIIVKGKPIVLSTIPKLNIGCGIDYESNKIIKYDDNIVTSVKEEGSLSFNNIVTLNVYPLPSNNLTNIIYSLNEDGNVLIELFDIMGEKIEVLFAGNKAEGEFKIIYNASNLASGIYFLRLIFYNGKSKESLNKKLLFLK